MSANLSGRVAIVTGASRGIGRHIAETLALRGASVVVNYPFEREADAAAEVVASIEQLGGVGRVRAVQADVTRIDEIETLFAIATQAFGGIDIVVSNAGGDTVFAPIADTEEADYDRGTRLNAKAHFFVLREAARTVRDEGRIIVIASSTILSPYPGSAIYAGAKAAAETYARTLAKELGARQITVNSISPGLVDTEAARMMGNMDARIEMATRMSPLGRVGYPEDIADVVAFVASEEARWITAQNLRVGGGIV